MSTPFWDGQPQVAQGKTYADNPWDRVIIGGAIIPGLCTVDVRAARRVDEKRHTGSDGETITFHGRNPARVEITVRIWTQEQDQKFDAVLSAVWAQYGQTSSSGAASGAVSSSGGGGIASAIAAAASTALVPLVSGVPASTPADKLAFDVVHPALSKHGIKAITVIDLDGPRQGNNWGEKVWILHCVEYMPAKKTASKPATPLKPVATTANLQQLGTSPVKHQPQPDPSTNPQDTGPVATAAPGQSGPF